jgi:hypothetical protein
MYIRALIIKCADMRVSRTLQLKSLFKKLIRDYNDVSVFRWNLF